MEMYNKNVCVLLSTYNGAKYLREQLNSILNQEGVNIRILVRDDGSTDETISILKEYAKSIPDIFFWEKGENVGFAKSFTRLLQRGMVRFPDCCFFAFADQDDVWLSTKLKAALSFLVLEPLDSPIAYCSNLTLVNVELKYIREAWKKGKVRITKPRALIQSFATGCTMVFNRRAADLYVSHLPKVINAHDFFMYQLCIFLGKLIWDEHSYILYRQHDHNQIGKPDYWGRWRKRLKGHYKEHTLEKQNRYFLEAFRDMLSLDDISLIENFVDYRKNIFKRLALLCNTKISYTMKESDFFFRLKVLCGIV